MKRSAHAPESSLHFTEPTNAGFEFTVIDISTRGTAEVRNEGDMVRFVIPAVGNIDMSLVMKGVDDGATTTPQERDELEEHIYDSIRRKLAEQWLRRAIL